MPREIQKMALAVLIFSEGFGAHLNPASRERKKPPGTHNILRKHVKLL